MDTGGDRAPAGANASATPASARVQAADPASAPATPSTTQRADEAWAASPADANAPLAPIAAAGAPAPAFVPKSPSRLVFAVSPWGEVYVDGQRRGVSPPMKELKLAPGKYTIEIRNSTFPPYRQNVDLRTSATTRLKHRFQ